MVLRRHQANMTEYTAKDHFLVHTGQLFDPREKDFIKNATVVVDAHTGLIVKVTKRQAQEDIQLSTRDIDLSSKTVLPGFIDAHTHIFLHAYTETPSINQERDEGLVERIIRATNHCRAALLAGYTTYRDLGTEGAHDADIGVRDAVNRGLIPGPRLFVATEALASSGGYAIRQENHLGGCMVPRISDPCDGVDGVRAAVRRRLGAGADVIKFYADYRKRQLRFPPQAWPGALPIQHTPSGGPLSATARNPNYLQFGQDEMDAIVMEAKIANCPVAAHTSTPEASIMAAKAGVTTIEHGYFPSDEALKTMKEHGTIFVPTLAVFELFKSEFPEVWPVILEQAAKAHRMGIKMACGGDTGAFNHGENAREMELLVEAGVPIKDVLSICTLGGWEACGGDWCGRRFGAVEEGWAADFVALDKDPTTDIKALREVHWVMKDGKVVVEGGRVA